MKTTTSTTTAKRRMPSTTNAAAIKKIVENYNVDVTNGQVYNKQGIAVGGSTYEPRITVHLGDRKYNARVNKVIGFKVFGPEALHKNVQIRHRNGDKFDNRGSNLELVRLGRTRKAA